jgi:hypothetical protein
VRFLKSSVKVVRQRHGLYFVGSLWKRGSGQVRSSAGFVIPILGIGRRRLKPSRVWERKRHYSKSCPSRSCRSQQKPTGCKTIGIAQVGKARCAEQASLHGIAMHIAELLRECSVACALGRQAGDPLGKIRAGSSRFLRRGRRHTLKS